MIASVEMTLSPGDKTRADGEGKHHRKIMLFSF